MENKELNLNVTNPSNVKIKGVKTKKVKKEKSLSLDEIGKLPTYEQRLKALNSKPSLFIAFGLCYRYVKYFKAAFFLAVGSAILSTVFNILVILGVSELTKMVNQYLGTSTNINELTKLLE